MNEQPEILSFVKAMADTERLRIVGLLSLGDKRATEIASAIGIHPSEINRHLDQLIASGVVSEAEGVYQLNEKAIEALARGQFAGKRLSYEANQEEPEDVRKVLKNYLNPDGTLKQIPPLGNKLLIILNFIVDTFAFDTNYTEKEVNTILRRYLVDNGLMARESDGTRYWRVKK